MEQTSYIVKRTNIEVNDKKVINARKKQIWADCLIIFIIIIYYFLLFILFLYLE